MSRDARAELEAATAAVTELRALVAERRVAPDALHVAEYRLACARRAVADRDEHEAGP